MIGHAIRPSRKRDTTSPSSASSTVSARSPARTPSRRQVAPSRCDLHPIDEHLLFDEQIRDTGNRADTLLDALPEPAQGRKILTADLDGHLGVDAG